MFPGEAALHPQPGPRGPGPAVVPQRIQGVRQPRGAACGHELDTATRRGDLLGDVLRPGTPRRHPAGHRLHVTDAERLGDAGKHEQRAALEQPPPPARTEPATELDLAVDSESPGEHTQGLALGNVAGDDVAKLGMTWPSAAQRGDDVGMALALDQVSDADPGWAPRVPQRRPGGEARCRDALHLECLGLHSAAPVPALLASTSRRCGECRARRARRDRRRRAPDTTSGVPGPARRTASPAGIA